VAKKYKAKAKPEAEDEQPERKELKDLLTRIRDRFKLMSEADQENRRKALEDLRFVHQPGEQWDLALKKERGDRPCYEFNKLRITIKRVINHIRANRPSGKVRAVEDGDKDTAEIYEGQIRNVWNTSDGDTVIDYASEYVVAGGMGAWRITTEYSDDTVFDQDIFIRPIKNPFCLYADPAASDPFKRDAEDWILTEKIANSAYQMKYPKAKRVSFEDVEFDDDEDWQDDEFTRVCEYWYKKPYDKTLYLLQDGKTVDALQEGQQAVKERQVKCYKICMVIASGDAILEGPTEWAGSMFPFVMVHGEWRVIDGKIEWCGLTRFSKDAQRAYNVQRTSEIETVALTPQAKWVMTPKQFEGLEQHIAEAHKKNYPVMFYNSDGQAPPPQWLGGAQVPVGSMHLTQIASDDIKATSGIFDSSLGQVSNETSGRAIRARQEQGEIATYNFPDNISKGVRRTFEILIDLIPKVYDTQRSLRILGSDGAEKYIKVNQPVMQPDGSIVVQNDLTRGKYDVTVTSGPSFSTQRQEAAEVYTQIAQAVPQMWAVAGDLMVKSMDLPYSADIADRMKSMLPPEIQQQLSKDKPMPPEVQAAMKQVAQAMQIVQAQSQLVQQAAAEADQGKAEADKAKSEVEQALASLKAEQAQFEGLVAKELAKIATAQANLKVQAVQLGAQADEANAASENANATTEQAGQVTEQAAMSVAAIQQMVQHFTQVAAVLMQKIDESQNKPKTSRQIRAQRGPDGALNFSMADVDELGNVLGQRNGSLTRQNGEIMGRVD
jgi:hypothetical protein